MSNFVKGDAVKILTGAKFETGATVPTIFINKEFFVIEAKDNGFYKLGQSKDTKRSIGSVHEKDLVKFGNELPLIKTFNGTYQQWLNQNISDSRVIKMKVILLLQEDDTPSYVDAICGYSTDAKDTNYLYYKYDTSQYRQVSATDNVIVYYI